jgi:NAD(P)-dependent dehydrogenase (short-subunit alcohol dehydrogenase family)
MLVEPGFFRTELLTPDSTKYATHSIEDYGERGERTVAAWESMNGKQGGDPRKLADAIVHLASLDQPPLRFVAGTDAVAAMKKKANDLLVEADAHRELSNSLALDDEP